MVFAIPQLSPMSEGSQPHSPGWALGESSYFLIFPQISIIYYYFSSNFYFCPHFTVLQVGKSPTQDREVNKNNLLGRLFLFFFCPKIQENNKLGGQLLIFEHSCLMRFSWKLWDVWPFQHHHWLIHNVGFHEQEFWGVLILSNKLRHWQISGLHWGIGYYGGTRVWVSPLRLVNFANT